MNGLSVWRVTAFQPMPTVYTASLTALVGVLAFRFIFLKCIYRCHAQLRVAVSRYTCIYSLGERVFQLVSRLTLINNSLWSSMWKEDHAHIVPLQAKRKKWSSLPLSFFLSLTQCRVNYEGRSASISATFLQMLPCVLRYEYISRINESRVVMFLKLACKLLSKIRFAWQEQTFIFNNSEMTI